MSRPTKKIRFVQLACGAEGEGDGFSVTIFALSDTGDVYTRYEHRDHGWGWWRVKGDDKRGAP